MMTHLNQNNNNKRRNEQCVRCQKKKHKQHIYLSICAVAVLFRVKQEVSLRDINKTPIWEVRSMREEKRLKVANGELELPITAAASGFKLTSR